MWWCHKCKKIHTNKITKYPVYGVGFWFFEPGTCEKPKENTSNLNKVLLDILYKHHY